MRRVGLGAVHLEKTAMNERDYNASRPLEEQAAAVEAELSDELMELLCQVAERHGPCGSVRLLIGLIRTAREAVAGVWP